MKQQTGQLLADLKEGKTPPPLPDVDAATEIGNARQRYIAREALAALPLDQPAVSVIYRLLGPSALDVSADEPIAPQLDKLLGPSKLDLHAVKPIAEQIDELLGPSKLEVPLDEPVSPHLDWLLGPIGHGDETDEGR